MVASSRREGRERALTLLYEAEMKGINPRLLLDDLPLAPDPFTTDLVGGVGDSLDELDALIGKFSRDWPVDRLATIDRNVLRLAVFELRYRPDVPTAVVISEAVELAKQFSTEESGRFVNGVLASVATDVR